MRFGASVPTRPHQSLCPSSHKWLPESAPCRAGRALYAIICPHLSPCDTTARNHRAENGNGEDMTARVPEPAPRRALDRGHGMSVTAVSDTLGVSRKTVLRWTRSGALPHFRLSRKVFVFSQDLEDFIEKMSTRGGGA